MKKIFNYILSATLIFTLASCNEDDVLSSWVEQNPEAEAPSGGDIGTTLDLSNYVALGNSLTAGFMDGALYDDGQSMSYVNLLASQMQLAGATASFNQPDINSVYGYNSIFSSGENIAGRSYLDLSIPGPNASLNGELPTAYSGDKSALNNFGVPGARLSHLDANGYGTLNGLFGRFAVDPGTSSILGDALATTPSFFSLWIGANDYLGYAITGGQGAKPLDAYSQSAFQAELGSVLGQLTAGGAEGVVLTLPPVVTLPLFQAVAYNAIPLDQATADALNSGLAAANGGIQAATSGGYSGDVSNRLMSYAAGNNPILVIDEELDDLGPYWDNLVNAMAMTAQQRAGLEPYRQSRPLVAGELVLLSAAPLLGVDAAGPNTPIGLAVPLGFSFTAAANGDQYFLNIEEQTAIVTARATYNGVIAGVVAALNGGGADIALVDVQPTFVDALGLDVATATALALPTGSADGVKGIDVSGFLLQPDFSPNGVMSTDAVHPNPRGHALIANLIIAAINDRWGASITPVDVLPLRGVYFQ